MFNSLIKMAMGYGVYYCLHTENGRALSKKALKYAWKQAGQAEKQMSGLIDKTLFSNAVKDKVL